MEKFNPGIYPFSVMVFVITAILIFVFFRLFRYLLQYIRISLRHSRFLSRFLPAIELTAWTIYFLWGIQYLYNRGLLITFVPVLIFAIILLYLAWFGLKDLIAGVIFKTTNTIQVNDHISVAGITGKVTAIRPGSMEIEDHEGRLVSVPYSKITGNVLQKFYPSQSLLSHHFDFQIAREGQPDVFLLQDDLRTTILTLPWSSQKKEPKIEVIHETDKMLKLRITIYSLDESYFKKTEKFLESKYQGTASHD